jgi:hypothetical protein
MALSAACPNLAQYQQLAAGRLPEAEQEALLDHLEHCAHCAHQLHTLPEQDTVVSLIRHAQTLGDRGSEKIIAGLVERLSKLRPAHPPAGDAPIPAPPQPAPPPFGERLRSRNFLSFSDLLRFLESPCQNPRGLRGAQNGNLILQELPQPLDSPLCGRHADLEYFCNRFLTGSGNQAFREQTILRCQIVNSALQQRPCLFLHREGSRVILIPLIGPKRLWLPVWLLKEVSSIMMMTAKLPMTTK